MDMYYLHDVSHKNNFLIRVMICKFTLLCLFKCSNYFHNIWKSPCTYVTRPHNPRAAEVGRDIWKLPSPPLLFKQCQPEHVQIELFIHLVGSKDKKSIVPLSRLFPFQFWKSLAVKPFFS